ncbi:hypothetical protein B5D77_05115 [Microcystis sp. MC19]|nr:hypothetical protein B5D77_05115 [Microcystis sp. MC19]
MYGGSSGIGTSGSRCQPSGNTHGVETGPRRAEGIGEIHIAGECCRWRDVRRESKSTSPVESPDERSRVSPDTKAKTVGNAVGGGGLCKN